MRGKLIKTLRLFEFLPSIENRYTEFSYTYMCDYEVTERIEFPNYRFIIEQFNDLYPIARSRDGENKIISNENSIKAELKRMEADGLVMIGVQEGAKTAVTKSKSGPDFDEGNPFTTESIVLTTKGKTKWGYFWYKATENPVTTLLSLSAIIISIVGLVL